MPRKVSTRHLLIKQLGAMSLSDVREGEYELISQLRTKMLDNEGPTSRRKVKATTKSPASSTASSRKTKIIAEEQII